MFCPWNPSSYLFFSDSAPSFLYYSYIPIALLILCTSIFIFFKSKNSSSLYLLISSCFFVIWVFNVLIQWSSNVVYEQMFSWQMNAMLELPFFIFILLFFISFIKGKVDFKTQFFVMALNIPVILLSFSKFNIKSFYITFDDCGGNLGSLWFYIYIIQVLIILFVFYKYLQIRNTKYNFVTLGLFFLLVVLIFSNILGDLVTIYEVNIIGPVGVLVFVFALFFSIVKFQTFNIKLLAPQVLIFALIFLNFAILFIRKIENVRIIMVFTIIISSILGYIMIRAVKKVEEQREALDVANKQQENLLHFISHQVKGFFTKSRNAFSGLLEGDYGPLPEAARKIVQDGFDSDNRGVETVQQILNASNLKTGKTSYTMSDVNLINLIKDKILLLKQNAEKKKIFISFNTSVQNLIINADNVQLGEALKNLIDNSIRYTPAGKIDINLEQNVSDKKVTIKIIDTGVGISHEDMNNLFREGGRGAESIKINVDSTGYGLYIVKNIIEAHGGNVTAYSEGVGKGSTFTVVLPVK